MLEFLGFIALIAIIFGISFGAALTGFIKFVVIGFGIMIILAIVIKLHESKKGSWFVFIASILAILLGIKMINDDLSYRHSLCSRNISAQYYAYCIGEANKSHDEAVDMGWGYIICGGILAVTSMSSLWKMADNGTKKHPAKTR